MKKEFEGIHLIVQRNAKMHSKHEVFYCYKVFQTCNIEREFFFFFFKKKAKGNSPSFLFPFPSLHGFLNEKANTPFDFHSV
jgi:hypothetical protein